MAHTTVGLAAGTGDTELVPAPGVGNRLKIKATFLDAIGTVEIHFKSGASGTFHIGNATVGLRLTASTMFSFDKSFLCDENAPFVLNRIESIAVSGIVVHETVKVSDAG